MTFSGATTQDLEDLYRTGYREFVRVAGAAANDPSQGADIVQEGFARALAGLKSFRRDAPLEAWVWRIILNTARSRRARRSSPLGDYAGQALEPPLGQNEIRHRVAQLPARQRHVLFLRYFADLDYRSIAEILEIEIGTVSATLNAAHAALRRSLTEVSL